MNDKKNLSVVISAFNEEEKIKDCLESVVWADEIVFVDNSSTDSTIKIASKFTSKIFKRSNNLMLNVNKNFGFSKATSEWILCLDADEIITPELKNEIVSIINEDKEINGYKIPRKNILFGKWIQHTGWYPDHQIRLFRKDKGRFQERHVHELVEIGGEIGVLKNDIVHNSYISVNQFFHKHIHIYAQNEAKELLRKGYIYDWKDAIRFPFNEFLSRYFAREGYKDGFHGLMLSLLMAFYHIAIFSYIWEEQRFKEINDELVSEIEGELGIFKKEFNYWVLKERLKTTANPLKKLLIKTKSILTG